MIFKIKQEMTRQDMNQNVNRDSYDTDYTLNKILLYADDILTFITQPQTSMPVLLETIDLFSSFSGYRVNRGKS